MYCPTVNGRGRYPTYDARSNSKRTAPSSREFFAALWSRGRRHKIQREPGRQVVLGYQSIASHLLASLVGALGAYLRSNGHGRQHGLAKTESTFRLNMLIRVPTQRVSPGPRHRRFAMSTTVHGLIMNASCCRVFQDGLEASKTPIRA